MNWTPETDQRLLRLRACGFTFVEIAKRLNKPAQTVAKRYAALTDSDNYRYRKPANYPEPLSAYPYYTADWVERLRKLGVEHTDKGLVRQGKIVTVQEVMRAG